MILEIGIIMGQYYVENSFSVIDHFRTFFLIFVMNLPNGTIWGKLCPKQVEGNIFMTL